MANPTTGARVAPEPTGSERQMKTTMMFRNIANPRRTTLTHLKDAGELSPAAEQPEHALDLPTQTANPRRTVLMVAPVVPAAAQ